MVQGDLEIKIIIPVSGDSQNRNSSVNLGFPESELGVPGIWGQKNAGLESERLGSLESKVELEKLGSPVGRVYGSENEEVPGGRVTGLGIWDGGRVGVLEGRKRSRFG